jgi:multicomponent Na+:H+ antiporter subunit G
MSEWIVFSISVFFISAGLIVSISAVFGLYRFRFALNRMHATAMNDTLGLLLVLIGLMIRSGIGFVTFKMLMVVLLMWFTSPVSSHMIAKMQVTVDEHERLLGETKEEHYELR